MGVTAEFVEAPGLYVGNHVDILGVPVGTVTAITPRSGSVIVAMSIPESVPVPTSAQAFLMAPDIVNDRYVQLSAYRGGPKMVGGTRIPMARTVVPQSVDEIITNLDALASALGPGGANGNGAVTRIVHDLANTFGGNGTNLHTTIVSLSQALGAIQGDGPQVTATLDNLGTLTAALAADTGGYQAFAGDLSAVTTSLAGDDSDIASALSSLGKVLGQLAAFVQANQASIGASLGNLQTFTAAVAGQQQALAQAFDLGGLALENFNQAIDTKAPGGAALATRLDGTADTGSLVQEVCGGAFNRLLDLGTKQSKANELDLVCAASSALLKLPNPPGASAGPNLSLSALVPGST
jgi:virulence factor Mce-like protein